MRSQIVHLSTLRSCKDKYEDNHSAQDLCFAIVVVVAQCPVVILSIEAHVSAP